MSPHRKPCTTVRPRRTEPRRNRAGTGPRAARTRFDQARRSVQPGIPAVLRCGVDQQERLGRRPYPGTVVPSPVRPETRALDTALDVLTGRPLLALTGAGLSTDSGIPDYRGPASPKRTPMTYTEFVSGPLAQRRYWARSHVGWARMARALPNPGHHALAALEATGVLHGVITQNVDGLHRAAGSDTVIDLHGRITDVVCLGCRRISGRWPSSLKPEAMPSAIASTWRSERPETTSW